MKRTRHKAQGPNHRRSPRPSASGYNESELARAVGVSPSTVHRVLAGERKPSAALARALVRAGVSPRRMP
ncbi:MAG: helix-turn-helix transcriptional regulator [Kiritimatiellae bacterium]|jgi:transcriptional regulator with XRE-family HTH domain|nr:helix-turn-helix transcriptional regulator [Kiritimatiellia bacterium]